MPGNAEEALEDSGAGSPSLGAHHKHDRERDPVPAVDRE
jgi:hypothetical protein